MRSLTPLLLLAFFASPFTAQTVTLTRITDLTTPVLGNGAPPALDAGMVAFLGEDAATGIRAIYMTPADGKGPFTLIADENTPIPNVPGETFLKLDNPEIHAGVVGFTGGFELLIRDKQGIYLGSGGPLSVYYDAAAAFYNPQPFGVIMDGDDLAFHLIGPNLSDTGTAPFYMPAPDTVIPVGGSLPGGGDAAFQTENIDNPALGGGQVALSARVTHDGTIDGALYTWDVDDRVFDLVANWNTPIPGKTGFFEHFGALDTDGTRVAFAGQRGFLGFGGHEGVYVAPVGAGGSGPFVTVAEIGEAAPGRTEAFASFGDVAIDGNLVVFEAALGSASVPTGQGIYAWRHGRVFKIIDDTDTVDGQEILRGETSFRGLDGDRLALQVTFVNPVHPTLALDFGVYVAEIQDPPRHAERSRPPLGSVSRRRR